MSEAEPDPAAELATAQRRMRRRMLWFMGVGAAAVAAAIGGFLVCNRPGPEVPEIARPYFWQVNGPGGPSYLFGTLHIGYGIDDLPGAVLAAQERAHTTVVESDLLKERPLATAPAGEGRARLEEDVWRALAELTGTAEAELVTWDTSRLIGAVIRALAPRVEPMDRAFQARAAKLGKQLVFLDDRSLEALMDESTMLTGLTMAVRHRAQFRAELMQMVRRYATGEESGCAHTAGGAIDRLVENLNRAWKVAIEKQVRRGGVFVAIGCGHLAGPDSVVEYLRQQGLEVRRIDR